MSNSKKYIIVVTLLSIMMATFSSCTRYTGFAATKSGCGVWYPRKFKS